MKHAIRAILVIIMLGGLFVGGSFGEGSVTLAAQIRSAFALPMLFISRVIKSRSFVSRIRDLGLENQTLRAELQLAKLGEALPKPQFLRAKIFATYPFNDKHALFIAKGAVHGVRLGAAVLASPGIFLGEISRVEKTWSEARTVFDISHELPVRVGVRGVPGLLRGGTSVVISMLEKSKRVTAGDLIILAKAGLPYGLKIGEVHEVQEVAGSAWNEAEVTLPYVLGELTDVFIVKDF